jgi:hypothetical protein
MQEFHRKDQANHPDPESCVGGRKAVGEALTGAHAGQPSSCEIRPSGAPTPLSEVEKLPNNGGTLPPAEGVEERRPTEGKTPKAAASRTQSRTSASMARQRVQEVARRDRRARFTALLHHISPELLRESFYALKHMAAPGIDGVTWKQYEVDLQASMPNTRSKSRLR